MYLGWLATGLNVLGLLLLGRRQRIGWLFGVVAELLWIARAMQVGGMQDLMAISTLYCVMATWNYLQWRP
jgi:hypothetical protein